MRFISEDKLEVILEKRLLMRKQNRAAQKIQALVRGNKCYKLFRRVLQMR